MFRISLTFMVAGPPSERKFEVLLQAAELTSVRQAWTCELLEQVAPGAL